MNRDEYSDQTEQSMRIGLRMRTLSDDRLAFCKQIGVDDVFLDHRAPRGDVFTDEGSDFSAMPSHEDASADLHQ